MTDTGKEPPGSPPGSSEAGNEPLAGLRADLADAVREGGSRYLMRLTDEELAVLEPRAGPTSVVPAPHLAGMTDEQRGWTLATALRSLVSRELAEIANIDEVDAQVRASRARREREGRTGPAQPPPTNDARSWGIDLRLTDEANLVLGLRRTADRVLAVEQTTQAGTTHAFVFVHRPDLLLVERVTRGGLHLFSLANSADDAATFVVRFVDPFGVAARDGAVVRLDPTRLDRAHAQPPLAEVVENALVVSQLTVLARRGPGPMVSAYATGDAVWTVTVERPHAPSGVTAREVDAASLRAAVVDLLGWTQG